MRDNHSGTAPAIGDEHGPDSFVGTVGLVVGLLLFVVVLMSPSIPSVAHGTAPLAGPAKRTLAATLLIASWWITGPVPIAATSLLPIALFPLLGIMSASDVSASYTNDSVHLFLGGFILAMGIEKWGLHRRIAFFVIRCIGTSPRRLLAGLMAATAFLSLWISNSATTLMMLPIALAVVNVVDTAPFARAGDGNVEQRRKPFAASLLLGIAYSANVGGMGTPIGTPPNVICLGVLQKMFPDAPPISMATWMCMFVPLVLVLLAAIWWLLQSSEWTGLGIDAAASRDFVRDEIAKLGPITRAESIMLVYFVATALLWIFRQPLDLGIAIIPGWTTAVGELARHIGWLDFDGRRIGDSTVAIAMATLMFLTPLPRDASGRRQRIMDWPTATRLPWGVLLLFGGGFAVADAFQQTGLSRWIGGQFAALAGSHPAAMIASVVGVMTLLSEIASNTAITALMLPILASTAGSLGLHPTPLLLSATIAASCGFMMPVATPPNAMVYATGRINMLAMIRYGLLIDVIAIVLITIAVFALIVPILGVSPTEVPSWAVD